MRTRIGIDELEIYRQCPEKFKRSQNDPHEGLDQLELQYRTNLRKLMVRYYEEMLSGRRMSELELRRSWSLMWQTKPGLITRNFNLTEASVLNATFTKEERVILRGARALNALITRPMNDTIQPVIVDEPFSIIIDGITVEGMYDLVFKDRYGRYWIVQWSQAELKQDTRYDVRFPLLFKAFTESFNGTPGLLVDYLLGLGNYVDPIKRTAEENQRQLGEATSLVRALSEELIWRSIGSGCNSCQYKPSCLGVSVVQAKRPRSNTRKPSSSSTNAP